MGGEVKGNLCGCGSSPDELKSNPSKNALDPAFFLALPGSAHHNMLDGACSLRVACGWGAATWPWRHGPLRHQPRKLAGLLILIADLLVRQCTAARRGAAQPAPKALHIRAAAAGTGTPALRRRPAVWLGRSGPSWSCA